MWKIISHHSKQSQLFPVKVIKYFQLGNDFKKDITNSKIRPFWQALIILNYGDISTYYFEWNNVLMCVWWQAAGPWGSVRVHSPTHTEINCSHSSDCYSLVRGWEEALWRYHSTVMVSNGNNTTCQYLWAVDMACNFSYIFIIWLETKQKNKCIQKLFSI